MVTEPAGAAAAADISQKMVTPGPAEDRTIPFKMVMDDIMTSDPNFKGCMTDFFLPLEEVRRIEAAAPALPPRLSVGIQMPVGPESLREVIRLLMASLRFTLHGLQMTKEADKEATGDALTSLRLQMAAATKLQESIMAEAFKINPQTMRAFLVKEQLPRTVAPFLQKFFRAGAGGDGPLSGNELSPSELLGLDAAGMAVDGGSSTRVPPGCTIIVAPTGSVTSQQSGAAEQQQPPQQQLQQFQHGAQAPGQQNAFTQPFPFAQPTPLAQSFAGSSGASFPEFPGPFPFQAPPSPRAYPFAPPSSPYAFPPPYPFPGGAPAWPPAPIPGDPYAPPPGFPPFPYGVPSYDPPTTGPGPSAAYSQPPGRGRRPSAGGSFRSKK
jgi:hypothetical protein